MVAAFLAAASSIPFIAGGGLGAADDAGVRCGKGACAGVAGDPLDCPPVILAFKAAILAMASAFLRSTSLCAGAGDPSLERTRF